MKTLIASAILALASGAASAAGPLTQFDSQEFYAGDDNSLLVTLGLPSDAMQFQEGNYAAILDRRDQVQGDRIGEITNPDSVFYGEAYWPV